jgi:hypothetical protein
MVQKIIPQHKDKLGQDLAVNDCIAFPDSNTLFIGKIVKLNPRMITVVKIGGKTSFTTRKYPADLIRLESEAVTLYLLKN